MNSQNDSEIDRLKKLHLTYNILRADRARLIEEKFWIKDDIGAVRPIIKLTNPQKKLAALLHYCRHQWKIPARILALKTRKTGFSTYSAADCYQEVKENGYEAIMIAQDRPTTEYIFEILKRYHQHDEFFQPELKYSNARELTFKDREGKVEVHTANQIASTRGRTPQFIHGSEVAHWLRGSDTALSLFQSIRDKVGTTTIEETTANGEDAYFYPKWKDAYDNAKLTFTMDGDHYIPELNVTNKRDWNGYIPLFISCLDDPNCFRSFNTEKERKEFEHSLDAQEIKLLGMPNVTLEFLHFRRWTMIHKCQGNEDLFNQEYPITPEIAFIASGWPRFNIKNLNSMPIQEGIQGTLIRETQWNRKIIFKRDAGGVLRLYDRPRPGHRYVVGLDTAEGKKGEGARNPDSTVLIVLDIDAGNREVAVISSPYISEEKILEPLLLVAEWYNGAYINVETNAAGKYVATEAVKRYPRNRFYHQVMQGKRRNERNVGWKTTVANRNYLITQIASSIEEDSVILHDKKTIEQCKHFVWGNNGRPDAAPGYHDDHVFALGLAIEAASKFPHSVTPLNVDGTIYDGIRNPSSSYRRRRRKFADKVTGY